jgi:hypothetical protein
VDQPAPVRATVRGVAAGKERWQVGGVRCQGGGGRWEGRFEI